MQELEFLSPVEALSRRFLLPTESSEADRQPEDRRPHLGFRVGTLNLLLTPGSLAEVLDPLPTYRLPNTPAWCLGLSNLRGTLLPVFDLHELLREPRGNDVHLLVIGTMTQTAGLMIDGLPFNLRPEPHEGGRLLAMPELLSPHLVATYRGHDEFWHELDHMQLLKDVTQRL